MPVEAPPRDTQSPGRRLDRGRARTALDCFYSVLRGDGDYLSDVALGRISVDTEEQGEHVVSKIRAYESWLDYLSPHHVSVYGLFDDDPEETALVTGTVEFYTGSDIVTGTDTHFEGQVDIGDLVRKYDGATSERGGWAGNVLEVKSNTELRLDRAWTRAYAHDTDGLQVARQDGQDNWEFVRAAERVRRWMLRQGVDVRFGYRRALYTQTTPVRGCTGFLLARDLLTYDWLADTNLVQDNWRQGLDGIVLHSDHGHPEGWFDPHFRNTDLVNISVGSDPHAPAWCPIVFNLNCDSGFFDVETFTRKYWPPGAAAWSYYYGLDPALPPDPDNGPPHTESFCEELLRHRHGGGVAVVGASRGSGAGKNDKLIDGLFGALYDDYTEGVIPSGAPPHAHERIGDVFRAAMHRTVVWTAAPTPGGLGKPDDAWYYLQIWHLFGDPMLRVRPPVRESASDD